MGNFLRYFKISAPAPRKQLSAEEQQRYYRRLRFQTFLAGTLGYSLYYVCRTSLNVMKKPIIDSGMLDASQLGIIGSVLLITYAVGKFINGFLSDHSNIKRFMAAGLFVSAMANLIMGVLGCLQAVIPNIVIFVCFALVWGISGWGQSIGSPSAVNGLSRWYPLSQRGTYYGFFSASHNIGEFLSFIFVGLLVDIMGWRAGFFGASVAGFLGVAIIVFFMHDTPQSKGLPSIQELTGEPLEEKQKSVGNVQKQVLKTPAVWILAAGSACMYIVRYALNGWGILYLQEEKGFEFMQATSIVSINALLGIFGTVFSGWLSDKLFKGDRYIPALIAGIMLTVGLLLFLYGGNALWVNYLSMVIFGIAIGVLICFLGGLMAVDVVPREATGAALGVVGIASYVAAGIQDAVSGFLINNNTVALEDGTKQYDFGTVGIFWVVASVLSFLLPLLNKHKTRKLR